MIVLGLNAWHGDSSAALVAEGRVVAAVEEERFLRVKHWAGFPEQSVRYCLREAGITLSDVDAVAVNRDPKSHRFRKVLHVLARRPGLSYVRDRLRNAARVNDLKSELLARFPEEASRFRGEVRHVDHHLAHLASAWLVSGYDGAAVLSVDGFGDFASTALAHGRGTRMDLLAKVHFPHSLGLFYLAFTQYLGFPNYGDEYKVMGMAAYGKPAFLPEMRKVILDAPGGLFRLSLPFFVHHSEGVAMSWEGGEPKMGPVFCAPAMERLFGAPRRKDEPLSERHRDLAASLQARYEECFFRLLAGLHDRTGERRLALAGGCAMNSLANGKIFSATPFREVFIQPAAGDAGGALGAALAVHHERGGKALPRMEDAYLGPGCGDGEYARLLDSRPELSAEGGPFRRRVVRDEAELLSYVASRIEEGAVVGWFQGRSEWGPRALGNRSILVDPRRPDMKEILNAKIKRRESFRPFAPAILREATGEWFETDAEVPFMQQVFPIREEKRPLLPAVTHADGTGRLQTVTEAQNPRYYRLIREFGRRTGVPVLLNTSFNENEPVVNRPEEALDCFLRTRMDLLVLGDHLVERA
jgi:carbamoyltransferase